MIPVNEPALDGNEKRYLGECIDQGWISSEGAFVSRLEAMAAEYTDRKFAVAVSSGTAALDVAVAALELGVGDEVIVPTFTIISCLSAIVRCGATPVFVDADPSTWCMDVEQVAGCVTERTRAVMAVHIYGLPVDMRPLVHLCEEHGLYLIEDAAEGLGCTYRGQRCGSFGTCSTLSFYPNKLVTTGEGGMVLTDDSRLAERCRSLRNLCFQPQQRFIHEEFGWNYRMSNLQAAVGVAQFERIDSHLPRKREIGAMYQSLLEDNDKIELPLSATDAAENVYWVFGIVLSDEVGFAAVELASRLAARQIGTRPFFWPLHEQPVLESVAAVDTRELPVAERLARRGLYLPSGATLTDADVATVSAAVHDALS